MTTMINNYVRTGKAGFGYRTQLGTIENPVAQLLKKQRDNTRSSISSLNREEI